MMRAIFAAMYLAEAATLVLCMVGTTVADARPAGHYIRQSDDRPADCYGIPWCGCYLKHLLGLANSTLNLNWAPNWRFVGTPLSGPQVGAIAGSSRHVALIVGAPDERGLWLINDGNDGPVRIHRASLAWATFFRTPG